MIKSNLAKPKLNRIKVLNSMAFIYWNISYDEFMMNLWCLINNMLKEYDNERIWKWKRKSKIQIAK